MPGRYQVYNAWIISAGYLQPHPSQYPKVMVAFWNISAHAEDISLFKNNTFDLTTIVVIYISPTIVSRLYWVSGCNYICKLIFITSLVVMGLFRVGETQRWYKCLRATNLHSTLLDEVAQGVRFGNHGILSLLVADWIKQWCLHCLCKVYSQLKSRTFKSEAVVLNWRRMFLPQVSVSPGKPGFSPRWIVASGGEDDDLVLHT